MWRVIILVVSGLLLGFPRVTLALCDYLANSLEGSQVVPPVSVAWTGLTQVLVCDGHRLLVSVHVFGGSETVTGVHVHGPASITENGPVLFDFGRPSAFPFSTERDDLTQQQAELLVSHQCYLDVHTVEHPDGAVRGWLRNEVSTVPLPWTTIKALYR